MARVAIALGSNLGDRLAHLRAGVAALSGLGEVVDVSSLFETEPVGGPDQGRYLNAVAVVETNLEPSELLDRLLGIERTRGRVRDERWGPRTLDLDVVAYEDRVVAEPDLVIPHPRAHERGFVLAPLVEVWPEAVLADGSSATSAWSRVDQSGLKRWRGDWRRHAPGLGVEATIWVGSQVVLFGAWLAVVVLLPRAESNPLLLALGGSVAIGGVVVLEAARRSLGRELTPFPQPRRSPTLVDSGVYRWVRHPIYSGVIMLLAGAAVAVGSAPGLMVTAALAVFFAFKARVEERALSVGIPGYTDYLRRVRSRFIPLRTQRRRDGRP